MSKEKEGEVLESGVLYMGLGENFGQLTTDVAREKAWYDCRRGDGILMLLQGLSDIDVDTAELVVDGKKKLVTNPDHKTLRLEDDNWTPPDFKAMKLEVEMLVEEAKNMARPSGYLYISEKQRDTLDMTIREIKEMTPLNLWKALERARFLKPLITGWSESAKAEIRALSVGSNRRSEASNEGNLLEQLKEDTMARISALPMDPEMKERMMRLAKSQFHDAEIKEDPGFENDTGWLDREGRYFGCELGLHITLGEKLAREFCPDEIKEGMTVNGEAILEKNGWMKCTGRQWFTTDQPPNEAQIITFKKWCERWPSYKYNGTECGGPGGVEE